MNDTVVARVRARGTDAATSSDIAIKYYNDANDGTRTTAMTYRGLLDASTRLSGVLRRAAGEGGDKSSFACCVIMLEDGVEVFLCQLASMFAGLAVLPLSPRDPPSRLASVFADANVRVVVARDARDVEIVRSVSKAPVFDIASLVTSAKRAFDAVSIAPKRDDVSHVFFTSGSTGRPKGCVSTHAALLAYCDAKNMAHEIHRGDLVFCASSHVFDPHFTDFCSSLAAGATLVAAPRELTFTRLGDLLSISGATHCLTTPVLLATVRHVEALGLQRLKLVALGGESMTKALAALWISRGVRVANTYGVTECCAYQTFCEIINPDVEDLRSLGDPLSGNILVFAAEPGDDPLITAKEGQVAELWIGGAQVGTGYLNRPDLTQERFKHGLYRTGDIVRVCAGVAVLLGRRDDQVKISGQRVELGEIESAIRQACGTCIIDVKCVLNQSKQLVAWCTGEFSSTRQRVISEALRFLVAKSVPQFMVPMTFCFIEKMPMTSTGKVSRSELSHREVEIDLGACAISHGSFGVDLARIWSEELGVAIEFGDCDFVAMGGDSLTALRVVTRVRALVNDNDSEGGNFGEALGMFAPFELLKRPALNEYARFIRANMEAWPSKYDDIKVDVCDDAGAVTNDAGFSILYRVAATGHASVARLLVASGVAVEANSGSSPLHVACANAQIACIRTFLELGASANALGAHGRTPLLVAASSSACTREIIRTLVARGAKIDAVDDDKQTALHIAARVGASAAVFDTIIECAESSKSKSKLAGAKITIDSLDRWKRTALHWASVAGHRNACVCLLDHGADANIKDEFGETALDIAERRALCSAQERPVGGRPSTWADIARLLGGGGSTKHLAATRRPPP